MPHVLTFAQALEESAQVPRETCAGKRRLLIGNGHSIGCLDSFKYSALYQKITESGLSPHIQAIFAHFGESNFEAVLRALDDGAWLAEHYQIRSTNAMPNMRDDYETVKNFLANAISAVHPRNVNAVSGRRYEAGHSFFSHFDDIYSLNYDLLAYWTVLSKEPKVFRDAFNRDEDTPNDCCEYMPEMTAGKPHLYWLHGAIHLFTDGGIVYKRVWERTGINLLEQIQEALNNKEYPLFVAEGDSISKMKKIESSSYLSWCLRKFSQIEGQLFVYGHSLSDQDRHILDAICRNLELRHLWISLHGDPTKESNQQIIRAAENLVHKRTPLVSGCPPGGKKGDLTVHYFGSDSASVWG